jgi:hypothetical protein
MIFEIAKGYFDLHSPGVGAHDLLTCTTGVRQ